MLTAERMARRGLGGSGGGVGGQRQGVPAATPGNPAGGGVVQPEYPNANFTGTLFGEGGEPNASVLAAKAEVLWYQVRVEEAHQAARLAYELEPLNEAVLPVYVATMLELGLKAQLYYCGHQVSRRHHHRCHNRCHNRWRDDRHYHDHHHHRRQHHIATTTTTNNKNISTPHQHRTTTTTTNNMTNQHDSLLSRGRTKPLPGLRWAATTRS